MRKLALDSLKSQLDLEGKYVEFALLRTALTVERVVHDLAAGLSEPNPDGECRGTCPKCGQERAFAVNINTNRFNCFNKGCFLKGGGVIDLIAKLQEVTAKEASHLLACAYGIQPYSPMPVTASAESQAEILKPESPPNPSKANSEWVSRTEFEALREKVERLSIIVWANLFETGEIEAEDQLFEDELRADEELELARSG